MNMKFTQVLIFAATVLTLAAPLPAAAAELVMFESPSCSWCRLWHEEIGPIYPKTDEAKCAPLRRVNVDKPLPEDLKHLAAIIYTPTFVVMDKGQEVSRMVGYVGDDFFWPLLAEKLAPLGDSCQH